MVAAYALMGGALWVLLCLQTQNTLLSAMPNPWVVFKSSCWFWPLNIAHPLPSLAAWLGSKIAQGCLLGLLGAVLWLGRKLLLLHHRRRRRYSTRWTLEMKLYLKSLHSLSHGDLDSARFLNDPDTSRCITPPAVTIPPLTLWQNKV